MRLRVRLKMLLLVRRVGRVSLLRGRVSLRRLLLLLLLLLRERCVLRRKWLLRDVLRLHVLHRLLLHVLHGLLLHVLHGLLLHGLHGLMLHGLHGLHGLMLLMIRLLLVLLHGGPDLLWCVLRDGGVHARHVGRLLCVHRLRVPGSGALLLLLMRRLHLLRGMLRGRPGH